MSAKARVMRPSAPANHPARITARTVAGTTNSFGCNVPDSLCVTTNPSAVVAPGLTSSLQPGGPDAAFGELSYSVFVDSNTCQRNVKVRTFGASATESLLRCHVPQLDLHIAVLARHTLPDSLRNRATCDLVCCVWDRCIGNRRSASAYTARQATTDAHVSPLPLRKLTSTAASRAAGRAGAPQALARAGRTSNPPTNRQGRSP